MKVGIGPSSFAQEDDTPMRLLKDAGIVVVPNPVRRRMTEEEALSYLQVEKLDGLLAGLEPLNRRVLTAGAPRLRAVARVGIGISNVDVQCCKELGIAFSFTPDGPTAAVAEMTLAALLCLCRDLESMNREMHSGKWPKSISRSLTELTVLIVGYGRIGRTVAEILSKLGCTVLITDPVLPVDAEIPFERVSLHDGLGRADAVSLHAGGESVVLGEKELQCVKEGSIILNSARGGLVDEGALLRVLDSGRVAKVWFDAFWQEPYSGPLLRYPQALVTPHASTYTRRCRLQMETEAVRNLLRDLGK